MESIIARTQKIIEKLSRVRFYLNEHRLKFILDKNNITGLHWRNEIEKINTSFFDWIAHVDEKVVYALLELDNNIQYDKNMFCEILKKPESLKKVITRNGFEEIVDLSSTEGLKRLTWIMENKKDVTVLRHCDVIEKNRQKILTFEGDVIKCYDKYRHETKIILAVINDNGVIPCPYYVELLYTEKYGYLLPSGKPNKDNKSLIFKESIFNIDDKEYNYHVIRLTSKFDIIGNIFINYSILGPVKQ
jgi:hypothetical protein